MKKPFPLPELAHPSGFGRTPEGHFCGSSGKSEPNQGPIAQGDDDVWEV